MTDRSDVGLRAVAETTDDFGSKFFKTVANDNAGNLITSPLSAQALLAMAAYGAGGKTATQIRSALHIPEDDALGQSGYQSLIEILNAQEGVELRLANKIYKSIQTPVKPAYKELTAKKFLSSSQEMDFHDSVGTSNAINAWCEEQTNNRIKDVITPESISHDTLLVLVNAVYFKGQWKNKFNPSFTRDNPFHVNETSTTNVPTMFLKDKLRFGYLQDVNSKFIEIPYQGGEICMIVILPNEMDGLKTVAGNLDKVNLNEVLKKGNSRDVKLFLPKFKIESTLDLRMALENLGMTDMFNDKADFSGIADGHLNVTKVVQKAFIDVNEEGSEAAAATVIRMGMNSDGMLTEIFEVNRPFYYQIRLAGLNVPLFAGVYVGP